MNKYYIQKLCFDAKFDYRNRCWVKIGGWYCLVNKKLMKKLESK